MSIKQKFISAIALTFAVGAFGTFASAQDTITRPVDSTQQEKSERRGGRGFGKGMRDGKHGGGDKMLMRSLGQLNLNDAQKEQVRSIFENYRTVNQPQMEEMRGLGMKKRDGVITDAEQTRLSELRTQFKTSGDQLRESVLAILTVEQRTELDRIKEEMKQRKSERRQNRQDQTVPAPQVN